MVTCQSSSCTSVLHVDHEDALCHLHTHTHISCACRTQAWLGPLLCLPSVTENSRAVMPITPLPSLLNFSSLWEAIFCDSQFVHGQHSSSCVISSQNGQGRLQPFLLLILFLKLLNHSSQGLLAAVGTLQPSGTFPGLGPTLPSLQLSSSGAQPPSATAESVCS